MIGLRAESAGFDRDASDLGAAAGRRRRQRRNGYGFGRGRRAVGTRRRRLGTHARIGPRVGIGLRPDRLRGRMVRRRQGRVRGRQVLNRRAVFGTLENRDVQDLAGHRVEGEALAVAVLVAADGDDVAPAPARRSDQPGSLAGQHRADLPRRQGLWRQGLRTRAGLRTGAGCWPQKGKNWALAGAALHRQAAANNAGAHPLTP